VSRADADGHDANDWFGWRRLDAADALALDLETDPRLSCFCSFFEIDLHKGL